ncbi:ABC transporter family substrate-binding protein [Streptomyces sp. PLAI1-29]|uniref:ABC transporter family substrate-binding protein n=1 Tax=Streptomyces zingiberis TaxID=2053010 RepID=A0ABX1BTI4_9ACTN|nr:ABC transporter family substrate-binding protein [Streptomyces zingiberis]NJQ01022.1 ABC transporter family substrate-binding protein [Streptomyces zingiberis]
MLLAAVVLAGGAGLAGCGGDDKSAAATAPPDIAATDRGKVRDGGTLRWAVDSPPATLNAFHADSDATTDRVAGAALPALFTLDPAGRPRRNPDYLRSAEVVRREPAQVVVYRLNPRARWTDGRPLGLADFRAQWEALSGRDRAYWTARNAGYDRIERVEQGRNDSEIQVVFAQPYADWRALFTPLYPKSATAGADAFNEDTRTALRATAGPYAPGGRDKRKGTVTLVRNPRWWGERPKLDRIVLTPVSRERRPAALADGRLDVAEIGPPEVESVRVAAGRGDGRAAAFRRIELRRSLAPGYTQLALNGGRGPLADDQVRRAVARAVDRTALAEAVLKPLELPARPPGSHLQLAGQPGYRDNSGALGRQDAGTARAMLAEAGWRPGAPGPGSAGSSETEVDAAPGEREDGAGRTGGTHRALPGDAQVLRKDGRPLTLDFVLPKGHGAEPLRTVADRIAQMLAAVGVRTRIEEVEGKTFFRDHVASGDYDLALYSWPATAFPATDARPIFAKPRPAPDGSLTVEQNYTGVGTDRIDQLFAQAAGELDEAAAQELMSRADARIWAAAGALPLYQRPEVVAARPQVVNAGAFGFATPRWQDMGFRR